MSKMAAKQDDNIQAIDQHLIQPPGPVPPVLIPHPFMGAIDNGLSEDVYIEGKPAATVDSTATNTPAHIPIGGSFVSPPKDKAKITMGSQSVLINGKSAARAGDTAETCNDPADLPIGAVLVPYSTVLIGD